MTESAAVASRPPEPQAGEPPLAVPYPWRVAMTVAVIMVLLALLGVGMTTAKSSAAQLYWISMVPIYGILCILTAYWSARKGHFDYSMVYRQGLHWLGVGLAVGLDFFVLRSGEEASIGAGAVALLLLSLGCFTAGVHFQWLFILVGLMLGVTLVVVVTADQYLWLIFVVGLVTIILMLFLPRLFKGHG